MSARTGRSSSRTAARSAAGMSAAPARRNPATPSETRRLSLDAIATCTASSDVRGRRGPPSSSQRCTSAAELQLAMAQLSWYDSVPRPLNSRRARSTSVHSCTPLSAHAAATAASVCAAAASSDSGAASIAASHPSAPSRAHSAATADGGHAASSTTDPAAASAGGATAVLALPHGGAAGAGGGADGDGGALGTGGTVGGAGGGAGGTGGGDGAALATSSCNVRSLNASTHVALGRSHGVSDTHSPGWPGMSRCACSVQQASTRTGVAHVAPDAMDRVAPGGQSPAASVARCTSRSIIDPNFFEPSSASASSHTWAAPPATTTSASHTKSSRSRIGAAGPQLPSRVYIDE